MANTSEDLNFMKTCLESSAACINCAENSNGEGCAKYCRINAELASCTAKMISMHAPQLNSLVELTIASSEKCADICGQHKNDHCQCCANASRNLTQKLRQFQERVTG